MVDQPLSLREVEDLAQNEGRSLRSDPRKVSHFLARVIATIKRHQEESRQLKVAVERANMQQASTVGTPTTLSPMDALRYISDDDKAQLFGKHAQQQLEYMKLKQGEAQAVVKNATTLVQTLKYVLGGVDPTVGNLPVIQQIVQAVRSYEDAQRADVGKMTVAPQPTDVNPWVTQPAGPSGPSGPRTPPAGPSGPYATPPSGGSPRQQGPSGPWQQRQP